MTQATIRMATKETVIAMMKCVRSSHDVKSEWHPQEVAYRKNEKESPIVGFSYISYSPPSRV